MDQPEKLQAMQALAEMMLEAGCTAVIGLMEGQVGVLAMSVAIPRLDVVAGLRDLADLIERDDITPIGEVTVTTEEEE